MFHFACGLLIINEDYSMHALFFLLVDFRSLQAPTLCSKKTCDYVFDDNLK